MTTRLRIDSGGFFTNRYQCINLDTHPAPTVNTVGFGPGGKHWIEEDDMALLAMREPTFHAKKGKRGKFRERLVDLDREPSPTIAASGVGANFHQQYEIRKGEAAGRKDVAYNLLDAGKPPYRVPPMAEVRATRWNGLTVATTFAGAGGSSLGYRMAGFRVVWANEFVPKAQESYRANMDPRTVLDGRDIKLVAPAEILAATGLREGELDVLDGSPPCQAFSTAGKRERGWGTEREYEHGAKQKNEDLFSEYIRLLRGLKPRAFVAENVAGLVKGKAKGFFIDILRELKASGYAVEARLLDAQWLGVPQTRSRIIFVGVRADLGLAPAFPAPLPYRYSVREAIPWIGRIEQGSQVDWKNQGRELGGGAPLPAVCGQAANRRTPDQFRVEVAGNTNAPHKSKRARYSIDQTMPTVTARRATFDLASEPLLEGANGFNQNRGKSVDAPMATVQAGRPVSVMGDPFLAIGDPRIRQRKGNSFPRGEARSVDLPCPVVHAEAGAIGGAPMHALVDAAGASVIHDTKQGVGWRDKPKEVIDRPCPAITVGRPSLNSTHFQVAPSGSPDRRKFTIAELKRICAFPDDFQLEGTYGQQWERLGNSVPPLMMRAIAEAVRDKVLLAGKRRSKRGGPTKRRGPGKPRKS